MRRLLKSFIPFLALISVFDECRADSSVNATSELKDLKSQVALLMARVNELETRLQKKEATKEDPQGASNKPPIALSKAEPAPSDTRITSGNDKVKLSISGHVNRAILYGKNGKRGQIFHVDNDASPTRVRFVGSGRVNEDITVGSILEGQMESNSTADIQFRQSSPAGGSVSLTERKAEVFVNSKCLGKLSAGQGESASDGTNEEADLSGTGLLAAGASAELISAGLSFEDHIGMGPRIKDVYSGMDGNSRTDRVRYDTPAFFDALMLSVSHNDGDSSDCAFRFSGELEETKIKAMGAYVTKRGDSVQYNASSGLLFPCGFSVGVAGGLRRFKDPERRDANLVHGKLGYQFDYFDSGRTYTSIEYGQTKSLEERNDTALIYGASLVQKIDNIATELYLGARWHDLRRKDRHFKLLFTSVVGARIKF